MRGWGRGLRNAVSHWYVEPGAEDLAHQAVKYQQRDGWAHGDLLRLAHPYGAGHSSGSAQGGPTAAIDPRLRVRQPFRKPDYGQTGQSHGRSYLRTEANEIVAGRAKFVRLEFVEKVKQSEHWQHETMVPNLLAEGAEIWK